MDERKENCFECNWFNPPVLPANEPPPPLEKIIGGCHGNPPIRPGFVKDWPQVSALDFCAKWKKKGTKKVKGGKD